MSNVRDKEKNCQMSGRASCDKEPYLKKIIIIINKGDSK